MATSGRKEFQVAIVGGGVSGLVCAIALQKAGVPVQLFEAAVSQFNSSSWLHAVFTNAHIQAAFGEIGAGLGVGSLNYPRHV